MADWDRFSIDYDRIFLENPIYVDTLQQMVERIGDVGEKRIVDLGCGTGNAIERLLASFPRAEIVGIDPSEGMRELCSGRFDDNPRVRVLEGSALALPLEDNWCDCVFTNLALHHVHPDAREECAREIARVLKPGGNLIYADKFCDVDGPTDDPERARDIINKVVGTALYCLDHGAFDMAMMMLKTVPADIMADGEYVTTVDTWIETLGAAGFSGFSVVDITPAEFGTRIIVADR